MKEAVLSACPPFSVPPLAEASPVALDNRLGPLHAALRGTVSVKGPRAPRTGQAQDPSLARLALLFFFSIHNLGTFSPKMKNVGADLFRWQPLRDCPLVLTSQVLELPFSTPPQAFDFIIYLCILSPPKLVRLQSVACNQRALTDSETDPPPPCGSTLF